MRDKKRIKRILGLIEELWDKHPNQRLGQLLFNYTRFGTRNGIGKIKDIFHYRDKDIEKELIDGVIEEELKKKW